MDTTKPILDHITTRTKNTIRQLNLTNRCRTSINHHDIEVWEANYGDGNHIICYTTINNDGLDFHIRQPTPFPSITTTLPYEDPNLFDTWEQLLKRTLQQWAGIAPKPSPVGEKTRNKRA